MGLNQNLEENREELLSLKETAEEVLSSSVFADEPVEIQEKFKGVYQKVNELLDNLHTMERKEFFESIRVMRKDIHEIVFGMANSSNPPIEITEKEDGSVEIKADNHVHVVERARKIKEIGVKEPFEPGTAVEHFMKEKESESYKNYVKHVEDVITGNK